jgi:hypothetical protein
VIASDLRFALDHGDARRRSSREPAKGDERALQATPHEQHVERFHG